MLILRLILIVLLGASSICRANAQMEPPRPIETPIQDQWREPFEGFLRELGASDPKTVLGETKAFQMGGALHPDTVLFRIEDPSACSSDLCLTVVGRIVGNKFFADAMFTAGKRFTWGDHASRVLGFNVFKAFLVGERMTVMLVESPAGWIVAGEPKSTP